MIRSASGYGSGRSKTALTMLKIAVFAPMPSASVRIAITLKLGCFRSMRKAYRISCFTSLAIHLVKGAVVLIKAKTSLIYFRRERSRHDQKFFGSLRMSFKDGL